MKRIYSFFLLVISLVSHSAINASETKSPKNIIFLIGDGMSYNTVTATNYYKNGSDNTVSYQSFPFVSAMSTFNGTPSQEYRSDYAWGDFNWVSKSGNYTDSAPASTAFSTGKKTYDGAIGVDMEKKELTHVMTVAKANRKSTGVVTTVQFSHATPAGHVAHNVSRNSYAEIAEEMLRSDIDVIIGAGHPDYDDNGLIRDNKNYSFVGGEDIWNSLKAGSLNNWSFTDNKDRVNEIARGVNVPSKLCVVLPVASTTQQGRSVGDGDVDIPYSTNLNSTVNNLAELSIAAINVLSSNNNGFVLMIEGGAIDWANHANQKGRMIEEQIDFNDAVDAVIAWVEKNGGWDENLVVVTSDHECGYLLGPDGDDNNPNTNPIINKGKGQVPDMKYNSGNHTNMLVPVYAKGAGSDMFTLYARREDPVRGYYIDNTDIAKVFFALTDEVPAAKTIKNVIYMISDGMGRNVMDATNFYEGTAQDYESFPVSLFMSTYHGQGPLSEKDNIENYFTSYNSNKAWTDPDYVNIKPTDSAPAATAMGTGLKTYDGSININHQEKALKTLAEIAKDMGKAAGVISSVEFSHATPAAFGSAHNISRNNYIEIANEMLASNMEVIMGAGHPDYNDNGELRENRDYKYVGGETTWNHLVKGELNGWSFTDDKNTIYSIANGENIPSKLCFVARAGYTLQQGRNKGTNNPHQVLLEENEINTEVPQLKDMTRAALNVLNKNSNGFFIMIEGGAIDWACHANQKGRVIEEQMDFNRAVDAAIEWINQNSNWDETLLIITSDHECGYLMNPVTETKNLSSIDMTKTDVVVDNGKGNIPGMDFYSGNHTNHLVPFFAKGANAEWFEGKAGNYDTMRGYYIDNTEAAILIKNLWNNKDITSSIESTEKLSSLYDNKNLLAGYDNNRLTLRSEIAEGKAEISIINLSGQIVDKGNAEFINGVANYNIITSTGIYFVLVKQAEKSLSAKVAIR